LALTIRCWPSRTRSPSFSPTHILIGLRDEDRAGWQERGLLEALHERLRIPITVFDVAAS
jgi:hypothetical protein